MGEADSDRVFFHSLWFRGHNNPRYQQLLPRLRRLDSYLLTCSDRYIIRGLEYRAYKKSEPLRHRYLLSRASRRYRAMFTIGTAQIPHFDGPVVADVDDPTFSNDEVCQLKSRNLACYVVTDSRAGVRYQSLGVRAPFHVVPQGIALEAVDAAAVDEISQRHSAAGRLVVGYTASWLLTRDDRGGSNPFYNVDHLLELWDQIHLRVPEAQLWLVGNPGPGLQERCRGRGDILLAGRQPYSSALAYTSNFDIALYARKTGEGIRAVKVTEFMALGVPIVSYDYDVVSDITEASAGILVTSPGGFIDAVEYLARSPERRLQLGEAGRRFGARLDWNRLAAHYETDIFDKYLA